MKAGGMGGTVALAILMAVLAMSNTQLSAAQIPGNVTCGTGVSAPFNDAAAVVHTLQQKPGPCCVTPQPGITGNFSCMVLLSSGNASATICGPLNYCPSCVDVGNALNNVLLQCDVQGQVQGYYLVDLRLIKVFYLQNKLTK